MTTTTHRTHMAGTRWDTEQYSKFGDQRLRPALELLQRIPLTQPKRIVDLGCGTGNITSLIAQTWPDAQLTGIDNSEEMLEQARRTDASLTWEKADIAEWEPEHAPDLIFSNATLQWLGDHARLFPRLMQFLAPQGCLAIQMPLSWHAPSHRLMRETLANGGIGGSTLGSAALRETLARDWVGQAQRYYDLLANQAVRLDIWETEYLQVLEGEDPVLEWVKGTGLRPILHTLVAEEKQRFLTEYTARLRVAYPRRSDGKTCFPFRRLFIVAVK